MFWLRITSEYEKYICGGIQMTGLLCATLGFVITTLTDVATRKYNNNNNNNNNSSREQNPP